jgi:hypothetical protein
MPLRVARDAIRRAVAPGLVLFLEAQESRGDQGPDRAQVVPPLLELDLREPVEGGTEFAIDTEMAEFHRHALTAGLGE